MNHRCTSLGLLPVEIAELRVENSDLKVDERFSLYRLTISDLVSLEKFVPETFWRGAQKRTPQKAGRSSVVSYEAI